MFTYTAAFFCNSQDQELPRRSLTVKQTVELAYHGNTYHSRVKRNELLTHLTTLMSIQGIRLGGKKTIPKGYLLYNSIYITFLKWQNYRKGEWITGYQMLRKKFVGEEQVCL